MSVFGNTTGSSGNPFGGNTYGNASSSSSLFQTNGNPFGANQIGNASFNNSPFQTSQNPLALNTSSSASSPFQATFGQTSSASSPFQATFGQTGASSSPFQMTFGQSSSFQSSATTASSPLQTTFGQTGSASSPFQSSTSSPFQTTFGQIGSSSSPFQSSASSPFQSSTSSPFQTPFGQIGSASSPFQSSASSPFPSTFGQTSSSSSSFQSTVGQTGYASSPFQTPFGQTGSTSSPIASSFFGLTSTGQFGSQPGSSTTTSLTFGVRPNTCSSSGAPGFNNIFAPRPFGTAPASVSQSNIFGQTASTGSTGSSLLGANFSVTNGGPFSFGSSAASLQSTTFNTGNNQSFQQPQNFAFGVTQPSYGQNKGSKIIPYAATKSPTDFDKSTCSFISISCMPVYNSKSHEELRWEDYELKSGVAAPANATSSPFTSPFLQTPSFPSPAQLWNSVASTTTTAFPSTVAPSWNIAPSTFTPSVGTQPSSSLQSTFRPGTAPSNTTPSTTSLFPQPSNPPQNPFLSNSTPSTSTTFFTPPSTSLLPTPSATTTPSWPSVPSFILSSNVTLPATSTPAITQPVTNPPSLINQPLYSSSLPGNSQTNHASNSLPGNNGPSLPQPFPLTGKVGDNIVAVSDPFGSEPENSQPSISHPILSPLTQNGISSMPVIDKPATRRISPLVSSRHISVRPLTVHSRKYHPRSDEPKVPFFDHTDNNSEDTRKTTTILPRKNPKSVFGDTSEASVINNSKDGLSPSADAFAVLHEDGTDKAEEDQCSSSIPDTCNVDVGGNERQLKQSVSEKCVHFKPSVPKLLRSDYYSQPSVQELTSLESIEPGFCSGVKDFVVGRHGYGSVKFEGETDVRELDLDALVYFNKLEVIVYSDDTEKPAVGHGLNKAALVTLLNVKCTDKTGKQYTNGKMVDKFMEKLKKVAENQGAEFVSYDAVNGVWKFHVQHFSRYGISQEIRTADDYMQ